MLGIVTKVKISEILSVLLSFYTYKNQPCVKVSRMIILRIAKRNFVSISGSLGDLKLFIFYVLGKYLAFSIVLHVAHLVSRSC